MEKQLPTYQEVKSLLETQFGVSLDEKSLKKGAENSSNLVVAGQSVTSAILHLMDEGPLHVKDIDVFYEKGTGNAGMISHFTPNISRDEDAFIVRGMNVGVAESSRWESIIPEDPINYFVSESKEEGIFNFVTVRRSNYFNSFSFAKDIINGFDLNMVQVGLDLENEKLVYTDDFINYLNTKQIENKSLGMPTRTLLRMFKKQKDIGGYFNQKQAMELLATAFKVWKSSEANDDSIYVPYRNNERVNIMKEYVSEKLMKEWNDFPELAENFKFTETGLVSASTGRELYELSWANPELIRDDWVRNMRNYPETIHPVTRLSMESMLSSGKWKSGIVERYIESINKYSNLIKGMAGYEVKTIDDEFTPSDSKLGDAAMIATLMKFGPDLIKTQFDKPFLKKIERMNKGHPNALKAIMDLSSSVETFAQLISKTMEFKKEFGSLVFGQIENLHELVKGNDNRSRQRRQLILDVINSLEGSVDALFDKLHDIISEQVKRESVPVIEPFFSKRSFVIETALGAVTVKELISPLDLRIEGDEMRHCAGGYSHTLENKTSRLFSLTSHRPRDENDKDKNPHKDVQTRSTLQIDAKKMALRGYNKWVVAQHRGKDNRPKLRHELIIASHMISGELLGAEAFEEMKGITDVDQAREVVHAFRMTEGEYSIKELLTKLSDNENLDKINQNNKVDNLLDF